MTRTRISALLFVVASSLAGCAGTGHVEYAGEVRVTSPDLVEIGPGVQVIADAEEPVFYSQGDYWLYRNGYWFRSRDYQRGYVRVEYTYVPEPVRLIERPQTYVHYRANLGRAHQARTPQMQRRSQPAQPTQPTQLQPQPPTQGQPAQPANPSTVQPTTPATTAPARQPTAPHDHHPAPQRPTQPGPVNRAQPTTPPAASDPVQTPNDHRRAPEAQRNAPPEIDRTSPGNSGNAPGQRGSSPGQVRPEDRGPSAAPAPQGPSSPGATSRPTPAPKAPSSSSSAGETSPPQDRADQATPPARNNTDDRTKKLDEKKDKNASDR